jgi:uncharacterized repeat protein (TIGR03803 family)
MTHNSVRNAIKPLTTVTMMLFVTLTLATSAAAEYRILHQFTGTKDGANPSGELILGTDGSLYGTAAAGGAYGWGTIFRLKFNTDGTWTETVLYNFTGAADGGSPSGIIFDAAGDLYGTTYTGGFDCGGAQGGGCGVVFKLTPHSNGAWTETVLHTFTQGTDGAYPVSGLSLDAAGNLYGTTLWGGASAACPGNGCGTVFQLKHQPDGSWAYSVIHSFIGSDGAYVRSALIFGPDGDAYGTTYYGDPYNTGFNWGTVFKLEPQPDGTWDESVLYGFTGDDDGGNPVAGVILDAAGNLYGTTINGGIGNAGVVFKLTPNPTGPWTENTLYIFTGVISPSDGAQPLGLTFDAAGNLYGTTTYGGASGCTARYDGCGVVFKLTPTSSGPWNETLLHTFSGLGKYPEGGLTLDKFGTLYGTVSAGTGTNGFLFEITKNCIEDTFVMPYDGTLYLQQKGGEAGATTEFGIGTSPTNFVKYYSGLPNSPSPTGEVKVGYFAKGTVINFGMFTQFGAQSGWAFSAGSTPASVVAFSDIDNSLHMGGKIAQQTSTTTWLLHLDDTMSYLVDDDDNDVLMQIRVAPQN